MSPEVVVGVDPAALGGDRTDGTVTLSIAAFEQLIAERNRYRNTLANIKQGSLNVLNWCPSCDRIEETGDSRDHAEGCVWAEAQHKAET